MVISQAQAIKSHKARGSPTRPGNKYVSRQPYSSASGKRPVSAHPITEKSLSHNPYKPGTANYNKVQTYAQASSLGKRVNNKNLKIFTKSTVKKSSALPIKKHIRPTTPKVSISRKPRGNVYFKAKSAKPKGNVWGGKAPPLNTGNKPNYRTKTIPAGVLKYKKHEVATKTPGRVINPYYDKVNRYSAKDIVKKQLLEKRGNVWNPNFPAQPMVAPALNPGYTPKPFNQTIPRTAIKDANMQYGAGMMVVNPYYRAPVKRKK